jgi:hypothetical protein
MGKHNQWMSFSLQLNCSLFDSVDLDIEAGTGTGYVAFVNALRRFVSCVVFGPFRLADFIE